MSFLYKVILFGSLNPFLKPKSFRFFDQKQHVSRFSSLVSEDLEISQIENVTHVVMSDPEVVDDDTVEDTAVNHQRGVGQVDPGVLRHHWQLQWKPHLSKIQIKKVPLLNVTYTRIYFLHVHK